ncbi:protein mesh [Folsomia candida]|uniref:protein mesh n=1 Tax=Folsomia candida TaxID=158441 RepID=UPI001604C2FB|nr:protein mesh [Folsomia candida]
MVAPLYSEYEIGPHPPSDGKKAGVYLQVERDLGRRTDQVGVEWRERARWDVQEGIIGAESFQPEHVIVATWKNVYFVGGSTQGDDMTTTFQAVIVTDEVRTYVIYNYDHIGTTPLQEIGGQRTAFVGFNAGNGSAAFEYAQTDTIRNLLTSGNVNGFPGRYIFRVDEAILPGQCAGNDSLEEDKRRLFVAPESGNMLGGTIVNVTGPCFNSSQEYYCRFRDKKVKAVVINGNRASCVMPQIFAAGYIRVSFGAEVNGTATKGAEWRARFFVESPTRSPELEAIPNSGSYEVQNTSKFKKSGEELFDKARVALVSVRFANLSEGHLNPILWSHPVPLVLFQGNIEIIQTNATCQEWLARERHRPNFTLQLPICTCTLTQALSDVGRFLPDPGCDKDARYSNCELNQNVKHCVISAIPTESGAGQQCCYDIFGDLLLSYDYVWGGKPRRSHADGAHPFNETYKVPALSHYLHHVAPFYSCCVWNSERSPGCYDFLEEVRVSQNCVGYEPPGLATVFGSLHFYTFDGVAFTFNPKGEFVLLKSNFSQLEIQGRFEQPAPREDGKAVNSTKLTVIAAREGNSATVEVRLRPEEARWRYKLDVLVNGEKVFFDRDPQKVQHFPGVTVYTPTYVRNQSVVIVMFKSGAGVEVVENKGHTAARVYLPTSFKVSGNNLYFMEIFRN